MKISEKKEGQVLIISLSGRMDTTTAPSFQSACGSWIKAGERKLILDCSGLEYISSAGLREILSLGKALKAEKSLLGLCQMTGMVREVFEISGLLNLFPVFESIEEAQAEF